jgi:hypothetical protein
MNVQAQTDESDDIKNNVYEDLCIQFPTHHMKIMLAEGNNFQNAS